jgi:hypothetical protein
VLVVNAFIECATDNYKGNMKMEALGVVGFVFGMMGVVAFVRTQKLIKTLKENGVLDQDYKSE